MLLFFFQVDFSDSNVVSPATGWGYFLPVCHAVSDPEPKGSHEWKCCLQLKLGVNAKGWTIHHPGRCTWRHMNILYTNKTYSETSAYTVCTQSIKLWDFFFQCESSEILWPYKIFHTESQTPNVNSFISFLFIFLSPTVRKRPAYGKIWLCGHPQSKGKYLKKFF